MVTSNTRENYSNYRLRLILHTVIPILGIPLSFPWILRYFELLPFITKIAWIDMPFFSIFSIFLYNFAWVQYEDIRQHREAKRLGAKMVPRFKGKWPGNFDFLWGLISQAKTDYMGQYLENLLREYGTTTLNIRLLWNDMVRRSLVPIVFLIL